MGEEIIMTEVEKLIRIIVKKKRLKQCDIAEFVGVSESHLSRCKMDRDKPSQTLIDKLKELAE